MKYDYKIACRYLDHCVTYNLEPFFFCPSKMISFTPDLFILHFSVRIMWK